MTATGRSGWRSSSPWRPGRPSSVPGCRVWSVRQRPPWRRPTGGCPGRPNRVAPPTRRARTHRAIADAIVQSYLAYMAQNHKNVSVELVHLLDQERLQIQEQFRRKDSG